MLKQNKKTCDPVRSSPLPSHPSLSRRQWLQQLSLGSGLILANNWLQGCTENKNQSHRKPAHVIIVGGGFAGATCARHLADLNISVTLIERHAQYVACPFSNLVLAGLRDLTQQTFDYRQLQQKGIKVIHETVDHIDAEQQKVWLNNGERLSYDRLVLTPGIDFKWSAIEGYDEASSHLIPHAWKAGPQTLLLRQQLEAMPDGGVFAMAIPASPYRCPPGPYERASLIAHYFKQHKPRSKLLLLDSKDTFSKQSLFKQAWQHLYGDMIEWQGLADGANVVRVEAKTKTLFTDFDQIRADVANVIPPQQAGLIAHKVGAVNNSGWCPIDPLSFESTLLPNVHVMGDAAIANAMPKSAFSANVQAKLCAIQIVRLLNGQAPIETTLLNTCYSLVAPQYGISVAGVYTATNNLWQPVAGSGGASALNAALDDRQLEAEYAAFWFQTITQQVFGT